MILASDNAGTSTVLTPVYNKGVNRVPCATETENFLIEYRVVMLLWFLFLFEPGRLISSYFSVLEPVKWVPTGLLLVAIFLWLKSGVAKYGYNWFLAFILVTFLGTGIAFLEGNWGVARTTNRVLLQHFMMGLLSFSFLSNDQRIKTFFKLYFWYILYFAAWGVYSLKVSPIDPSIDPGMRQIIPWHHQLDNRDGFGSLMVIGFAFCFYYHRARDSRINKTLAMSGALLCIVGVISSFGRGVFLGMVVVILFIWWHSKRKVVGLIAMCASAALAYFLVSVISPENMYWEQIASIQEGTSEGTGAQRKDLWWVALKEFADSPLFGVGTANFGIAAVKVLSPNELLEMGYTPGRFWGRALHCAPLTILSEYGLFGSIVFLCMMLDFIKNNRAAWRLAFRVKSGMWVGQLDSTNLPKRYFQSIVAGTTACFVAFWVNGIVYEIIYDPYLWNIMIMNRLLFLRLSERSLDSESDGKDLGK